MHRILLIIPLPSLANCTAPLNRSQSSICPAIEQKTVRIEQAKFIMGSNSGYPEEKIRSAFVDGYDIDNTEVTNAQFRAFVKATNYITTAEKPQPGSGLVGGAVFRPPSPSNPGWWHFVEGANWRHPEGPGSDINGGDLNPVVQVSLIDAKAYANWVGRSIPSEVQWEYAARAGRDSEFVWGDQKTVNGVEQANTWQGAFPIENTLQDGYELRAPIGCYEPNAFGLYDMIGNVWEWTDTDYEFTRTPNSYTIKGGSFLCAPNFCARYRAPARQSQEADFSTNHIGFRTVSRFSK